MTATDRAQVTELMRRIADGDTAAIFEMHAENQAALSAAVYRVAHRWGITLRYDEVQDLTLDAALAVAEAARGWRPDGGALPWKWAERRIGDAIATRLGRLVTSPLTDWDGDDIDLPEDVPVAACADVDPVEVLASADHDKLKEAAAAFAATLALRPRHLRLLIEVAVQESAGDPSPAKTVARMYGVSDTSVRQTVHRARKALAATAARDSRYRWLLDAPLLRGRYEAAS